MARTKQTPPSPADKKTRNADALGSTGYILNGDSEEDEPKKRSKAVQKARYEKRKRNYSTDEESSEKELKKRKKKRLFIDSNRSYLPITHKYTFLLMAPPFILFFQQNPSISINHL